MLKIHKHSDIFYHVFIVLFCFQNSVVFITYYSNPIEFGANERLRKNPILSDYTKHNRKKGKCPNKCDKNVHTQCNMSNIVH